MAARTIYINIGNTRITRYVKTGTNLLDVIQEEEIGLSATCGGTGRCGTCKVKIKEALPFNRTEEQVLTSSEKKEGYHLACQVYVDKALHIEVPKLQEEKLQVMENSVERDVDIVPFLRKRFIPMQNPETSDLDSIYDFLSDVEKLEFTLEQLRQIPLLLRNKEGFTLTFDPMGKVIHIEKGDTTNQLLGIAFDIGSTSVVGYLLDLVSGEELAVASRLNRQAQYGADVLSRISYATEKKNGIKILQKTIVEVMNEIIAELTEKTGIDHQAILDCTIVGNSTMQHLLLGISPKYLGQAPHLPVLKQEFMILAREIDLNLPNSLIRILPNLGGFVGSDTLGVILATKMDDKEQLTLAVDIGTNGEMVLGTKDRLVVCSSPAGPAFEGGQIRHGMRAIEGAIGKVWLEADLKYEVIGNTKPKGICGSGLVDLVAELLRIGVIDPSGRIRGKQECPPIVSFFIKKRIIEKETGNEFIIVEPEKSGTGKTITLTQQDVRELQLAKGAIYTGIHLLMKQLDVTLDQINEFYLAGGFGSFIDSNNAKRIGLIPPIDHNKIKTVGNAAGYGAKLALLSEKEWQKGIELARKIEHYNLSEVKGYEQVFVESLDFPKTERW
ncbi:ASKHA domain-containing protein [Tepidibacillus sp. LV47]|uniref:ASKHA domain-containing protein n=1 Tax=Tepidibacillus sp. LV47 TaxID=3398228 RepID=UPI003AABB6B2